jgi:hypothetical protein
MLTLGGRYILTPVYLRDQNVPASKGLSSILGIQTIEFLVKVIGGVGAVIYLVEFVPAATWNELFPQNILGVNVGLLIAGFGIALHCWRNHSCSFHMVAKSHLLFDCIATQIPKKIHRGNNG